MPGMFERGLKRIAALAIAITLTTSPSTIPAQEQENDSVTYDGGGQEVLQSIFIPFLPHAPFSLTLQAEWSRPMNNGGTFTTVNSRPIKRDSAGRIYQERWLMVPKGSNVQSRMSWIQIADPVAHTFYECNAFQKLCELRTLRDSTTARFDPDRVKSGPFANGKGTRTHEDLGVGSFAGLAVHEYKDNTTISPGVFGNDLSMSSVRQYRFCPELGINLTSALEAPQIGRQNFTVTEINTTEPDPSFFQPPQSYSVVDHRQNSAVK